MCRYCQHSGLITAATVLDHILALSLGGDDDPANLAPACLGCNDEKATAEKRFLGKHYDLSDVMRDPALADWIMRGRATPEL